MTVKLIKLISDNSLEYIVMITALAATIIFDGRDHEVVGFGSAGVLTLGEVVQCLAAQLIPEAIGDGLVMSALVSKGVDAPRIFRPVEGDWRLFWAKAGA